MSARFSARFHSARSAFCTRRNTRAGPCTRDIRYRLLFSLKNTKHKSDGDIRFGLADIPREFISQRRRNATRISRSARSHLCLALFPVRYPAAASFNVIFAREIKFIEEWRYISLTGSGTSSSMHMHVLAAARPRYNAFSPINRP